MYWCFFWLLFILKSFGFLWSCRLSSIPPKNGVWWWGRLFCLKLSQIQKPKNYYYNRLANRQVTIGELVKILIFNQITASQKKVVFLWKNLNFRVAKKSKLTICLFFRGLPDKYINWSTCFGDTGSETAFWEKSLRFWEKC